MTGNGEDPLKKKKSYDFVSRSMNIESMEKMNRKGRGFQEFLDRLWIG